MALLSLPTAEDALGSVVDNVDTVSAASFNQLRRYIEALALTKPRDIGDAVNGIRIDPDNQRIEFRGTARPTEDLRLHFYADVSGTGGGSFGGGFESTNFIFASNCATAAVRGCKTYGITIPAWVDVADTIDVVGFVQIPTLQAGRNVVWDVFLDIAGRTSEGIPDTAVTEHSQIGNVIAAMLTGGGPGMAERTFCTLPANTLQVGDHVALTVQRNGANPSDTYSYSVLLSRAFVLRCRRRYV